MVAWRRAVGLQESGGAESTQEGLRWTGCVGTERYDPKEDVFELKTLTIPRSTETTCRPQECGREPGGGIRMLAPARLSTVAQDTGARGI